MWLPGRKKKKTLKRKRVEEREKKGKALEPSAVGMTFRPRKRAHFYYPDSIAKGGGGGKKKPTIIPRRPGEGKRRSFYV